MSAKRKSYADRWVAIAAILLVVLPPAYVLSIGPAIWLRERGWISEATSRTIYEPVMFCVRRSSWAHGWVGWYANLWKRNPA